MAKAELLKAPLTNPTPLPVEMAFFAAPGMQNNNCKRPQISQLDKSAVRMQFLFL